MSLVIGFPVPFLMVIGAPVWMILLLGCFAKCWRHHICGNSALQTQIVDGMKMFVVQMSMIVIYPFYNYIFTRLSSVEQAWFSLVLLIIKLAIKNGISYYIRSNTDMQPEIVVFNVDVFNALFVSFYAELDFKTHGDGHNNCRLYTNGEFVSRSDAAGTGAQENGESHQCSQNCCPGKCAIVT
ncbi:hypothetical protein GQ600_17646 [Phytophthora cactorum]|nr:hypothetical protein GQ600_17646 [Phytophthora cactorum]